MESYRLINSLTGLVLMLLFLPLQSMIAEDREHPDPPAGTAAYAEHGYPWENNSIGISKKVPPPWTGIQRRDAVLTVWGRKFTLNSGVLPEQITSQGTELFAGPPQFRVIVNGKTLPLATGEGTVWRERTPVRHVREDSFERPACKITLRSVYEYDGLLQVKLHISTGGKPYTLNKVDLTLRFKKDVARAFSRFLTYDYERMKLDRKDFLQSFGIIDSGKAMGFHPTLWVGNERVGLEWVCETNANWNPIDGRSVIEMRPEGDEVVVTFRTVASPVRQTGDFTYTFGLYPTPVKPLSPRWRNAALCNTQGAGRIQVKGSDIYRLGWGLEFPFAYPGLPVMEQSRSKEAVARARRVLAGEMGENHADWLKVARQRSRKQGLKFIPYGALYQMPSRLPRGEWEHYQHQWTTHDPKGKYKNPAWGRSLNLEPGSVSARAICLYPKSIRDFLVWTHVKTLKEHRTDGLYFDVSSPNRLCRNPGHNHPAGGVNNTQYYPLFSQRKLLQRLYVACKKINPKFLITMHHGKCPIISTGFADIVLSGEPLELFFRKDGFTHGEAQHNLSLYVPDYSIFPDSMYRICYSQQNGVVNMLLPQIGKWGWPALSKKPDLLREYSRTLFARTLLYDIPLFHNGIDYEQYNAILRARGKLEDFAAARHIGPPDSSRYVRTGNSKLKTAIYCTERQRDRLMLVVANLGRSSISDTIAIEHLSLPRLGIKPGRRLRVIDAISGKILKTDGHTLKVSVAANDYVMLLVSFEQ